MEEKFLQEGEHGAERSSQFQTKRDLNSSFPAKTFAEFDLGKLKGRSIFCKDEKLKSRKTIDQLFEEGKSVSKNGFTLVYLILPVPTLYPAQAGFSVPKKFFKHAVDRNRVKRLMREAWRTNKFALYEKLVAQKQQMVMMWIYKGKELPDNKLTQESVLYCIDRLLSK